jgi:hypothetical protein
MCPKAVVVEYPRVVESNEQRSGVVFAVANDDAESENIWSIGLV